RRFDSSQRHHFPRFSHVSPPLYVGADVRPRFAPGPALLHDQRGSPGLVIADRSNGSSVRPGTRPPQPSGLKQSGSDPPRTLRVEPGGTKPILLLPCPSVEMVGRFPAPLQPPCAGSTEPGWPSLVQPASPWAGPTGSGSRFLPVRRSTMSCTTDDGPPPAPPWPAATRLSAPASLPSSLPLSLPPLSLPLPPLSLPLSPPWLPWPVPRP